MTKKTYGSIMLIILVASLFLQNRMKFEVTDIYSLLYVMVMVPGLVFMFKYFPKVKKQFHKKILIYLGFCIVLATVIAFFV